MKRRVMNKSESDDGGFVVGNNGSLASSSTSRMAKSTQNGSSSSTMKLVVPMLLITIGALVGYTLYQKQQYDQFIETNNDSLVKLQGEWKEKLDGMSQQNTLLEEEWKTSDSKLTDLQKQLQGAVAKQKSGNDEQMEKLNHDIGVVQSQLEHMRQEMQRHDKHALIDKFGEGPHRVEFQLDFPPDEIPEGTTDSFIIEMAPIDLMPHTVHMFLSQVSKGLLDGCSFHRNAGHVVQGGPISNHINPGVNLKKPFADADLSSVSFQEYHPDFPHKKYTLGYAGRPGGPDFYVSTIDNSINHGPGGQGSYAIASEADPCFAKVVDGFDAVDRMHKMSVKPGGYKRMQHYVAIKSVKILKK